jgi:hypothetical protein
MTPRNCLRDYVGEILTLPLKRGMTLEEAVIALEHHPAPTAYVGSLAAGSSMIDMGGYYVVLDLRAQRRGPTFATVVVGWRVVEK